MQAVVRQALRAWEATIVPTMGAPVTAAITTDLRRLTYPPDTNTSTLLPFTATPVILLTMATIPITTRIAGTSGRARVTTPATLPPGKAVDQTRIPMTIPHSSLT